MNAYVKKVFIVVGATVALAGCSLTAPLTKKESSQNIEPTPTPITTPTQTGATPTTEMGSPSYKVESTTPAVTPTTTTTKSDDPADLQKDLDSVSIESDFGSLVK